MKIRFSPLFLLPLCLLFFHNSLQFAVFFLLASLWHEAGHLFAARLFGVKTEEIEFCPMGAKIKLRNLLLSYKKELFIFLAGALFNLMLCIFLLFSIRQNPTAEKIYFFFSNFFFAVFNLMPLPGLDGSQALFSFLCLFCEEERAYRISFAAQSASLVLLAGAAAFLFLRYKNDSLILMTLFLFLEFREKNKATKHS